MAQHDGESSRLQSGVGRVKLMNVLLQVASRHFLVHGADGWSIVTAFSWILCSSKAYISCAILPWKNPPSMIPSVA